MNQCIDCERPVQFENDRCERCWREIDAEFELDPLERCAAVINHPELRWTVKQWMPGITTFKQAGSNHGETSVLVGFSGGPVSLDSGYTNSHNAAARDAINGVAESMRLFAEALSAAVEREEILNLIHGRA